MKRQYLIKKKLPDVPGVYLFKKGSEIVYIGKATSLRDRVKSYFSNDLIHTRGPILIDMITEATSLDYIKTDSVLEAFILETELIKKHQPRSNTKEKDDKSFNYVVITDEQFPRILVVRGRNIEQGELDFEYKDIFGPYPLAGELKEAMKLIRKIFPYRDKCVPNQGKPCFNRSIGLCPGVCSGDISAKEYGRQIHHVRLFFRGKKSQLMSVLKKEMKEYVKKQEFEKAGEIKRTMNALIHIQDISMIQKTGAEEEMKRKEALDGDMVYVAAGDDERPFRIEAYDIAHLSGKDMVGVMTVMSNGEYNKSEYRTFKIKSVEGSNDVGALREVITRRLGHPEWGLPDIVVVDGGKAQLNMATEVIGEMAEVFELAERMMPVVIALVKNEKHKARELLASGLAEAVAQKYARHIIHINAESHRFALAVHRRARSRSRGISRKT